MFDADYVRCNKTGRILTHRPGDDKAWCGRCQTAHRLSDTSPATRQEMDAQRASLPTTDHFKAGH